MLPSIEYLGHKISDKGIQPTKEKVCAIAPAPNNVFQLKAFLGVLNYYAKFLPNLSSKLTPLYKLLQKKVHWLWGEEQRQAFQQAKEALTSAKFYDPSKKLILSCVGAVFSQKLEDGTEYPVAFASRSLSPAEKKYWQSCLVLDTFITTFWAVDSLSTRIISHSSTHSVKTKVYRRWRLPEFNVGH